MNQITGSQQQADRTSPLMAQLSKMSGMLILNHAQELAEQLIDEVNQSQHSTVLLYCCTSTTIVAQILIACPLYSSTVACLSLHRLLADRHEVQSY